MTCQVNGFHVFEAMYVPVLGTKPSLLRVFCTRPSLSFVLCGGEEGEGPAGKSGAEISSGSGIESHDNTSLCLHMSWNFTVLPRTQRQGKLSRKPVFTGCAAGQCSEGLCRVSVSDGHDNSTGSAQSVSVAASTRTNQMLGQTATLVSSPYPHQVVRHAGVEVKLSWLCDPSSATPARSAGL